MKKIIAYLLLFFNIHLLRKEEKVRLYEACIHKLKNRREKNLICHMLMTNSLIYFPVKSQFDKKFHIYFPEIYIQKPGKVKEHLKRASLWFDPMNNTERILVFKKAITKIK